MLRIKKEHADEMISHSRQENPNECCGILFGKDGEASRLFRITNTAKSPYRYLMDPQQQLNAMLESDREGWDILAFYHSHTHSQAYPSQTDVRMALESGWLDVYYILVSLEDKENPHIRAFRIKDADDIVEEEFEVVSSD